MRTCMKTLSLLAAEPLKIHPTECTCVFGEPAVSPQAPQPPKTHPALLAGLLTACVTLAVWVFFAPAALAAEDTAVYVGAEACESCHSDQYESFQKNSSKAHSWESVEKMLSKLTPAEQKECYSCHTTGYGKPGGFKSIESTPELANVSCESCHGPGSLHAESGDPELINRTPDVKECVTCHNAQRIKNFNFKPMLYHGGH